MRATNPPEKEKRSLGKIKISLRGTEHGATSKIHKQHYSTSEAFQMEIFDSNETHFAVESERYIRNALENE